jgi:hypothetical protein
MVGWDKDNWIFGQSVMIIIVLLVASKKKLALIL